MPLSTRVAPFVAALGLLAMGCDAVSYDDPPSDGPIFEVVEEMPQLIGGIDGLQAYVRYPAAERLRGIEGRVFVQFIVEPDGAVSNAEVTRGVSPGLDREAIRVVRLARFTPGRQRGAPIRVRFSLPLRFDIPDHTPSSRAIRYRVYGSAEGVMADEFAGTPTEDGSGVTPLPAPPAALPFTAETRTPAGTSVYLRACGADVRRVEILMGPVTLLRDDAPDENGCLGGSAAVPF